MTICNFAGGPSGPRGLSAPATAVELGAVKG